MKIECQPQFVIISAFLLRGDTLAPRGTSEERAGESIPQNEISRFEALNRRAPSPQPSPPMGEREKNGRFMGREDLKFVMGVGALSRSRRRQSALIAFAGRWRGLTSAATRFMERKNLKLLTRIVTMNRSGPSPQPSPIRWEREKNQRFMESCAPARDIRAFSLDHAAALRQLIGQQ